MNRLSISQNLDVYQALCEKYSQPHRYYHNKQHVSHCIALLDQYTGLSEKPDEVEIALWFHDAIYNPLANDNERQSAEWAAQFLNDNGFGQCGASRVYELIIATIHDTAPVNPDTRLLVDIDLSILGADARTYQEFEQNIRREYRWVPSLLFKKARRKILQSFLDRPSIYSTVQFQVAFGELARANILAAIVNL